MRRYKMILQAYRLITGLFLLLAFTGLSHAHHLPKGDLNGDGHVDFADFIIFADNFNKPYHLQSKQPHHIENVVVRDTFFVQSVVHNNDAGVRAGRMLGFWYLNFNSYVRGEAKRREHRQQFIFNRISETPNADGEFTVHGKVPRFLSGPDGGTTTIKDATVTYIKSEDKYILLAKGIASLNSATLEELRNPTPGMSKTLVDLEVKFSIRHDSQRDMTVKLSPYWADTEHAKHIEEPIIEIDYMKAIDTNNPDRVFDKDLYEPINDGLRPCSREEFMYKIYHGD